MVNILTHIGGEREHKLFPVQDLEYMLKRILKEKSCLIVIDDVWKRNDFDKLQILLQCTGERTLVIITPRDKDAAIVASGKSIPLQLQSLTDKESWKLFLNKAHIPEDSLNDSVLISLKEKILRKYDGSPQAIIILAGLLSTRNLTEWSSVIEHAFLEQNILASSYEDLPPQTKPCFLYLGLFPGAFLIPVRRLLHLWLAEGLVTPLPEQNMASEDPADKYFKEIINRGLIEVARLRSDGSPETCHLPGILWDFLPKAVGSRLFHAHNTTDYTSAKPPKFNVQRLAEYEVSRATLPLILTYNIYVVIYLLTPVKEICLLRR